MRPNTVLIIIPLLFFLSVSPLSAEQVTVADSTISVDSLNDGPHLFWQDDSLAYIIYYCHGEVIKQPITGHDTLRFGGQCDDSAESYVIPVRPFEVEPGAIEGVSTILAVSDIHGDYRAFADILMKAGVIDHNRHWSWGDGHLVIVGDVFDRGSRDTECLWLIYRLEQEAVRAGGGVHYLLGNHELMVLQGDNRYVHERYLDGIVRKTRIKHEDLFGPDMELGRWLRSKNAVMKIGDILFVHGGVAPYVPERGLGIEQINADVRRGLDLRSSQLAFDESARFLFGGRGPFWYRGYHYEMEDDYPMITSAQIDSLLTYYSVGTIVVGHSQVDSVQALFDGRVMAIDVPVEDIGTQEALLWENSRFYRITGAGDMKAIR